MYEVTFARLTWILARPVASMSSIRCRYTDNGVYFCSMSCDFQLPKSFDERVFDLFRPVFGKVSLECRFVVLLAPVKYTTRAYLRLH